MRLVHQFDRCLPQDYPEDWQEHIQVVEDGDEETLYVDYTDAHFRRPMAPWTADGVREVYGKHESEVHSWHRV
jgi:hypothetical protein